MRLVSDDIWAVMTIWQEARGEGMDGKVAVAEVIRNRIARRVQSDGTVVGTVLCPYQFSGWNTEDLNRSPSAALDSQDAVVRECMAAWHVAMLGDSELTKGATHYFNPRVAQPAWVGGFRFCVTIGQHDFYAQR